MHQDRLTSIRGLASVVVVMFHALLLFRTGDYGLVYRLPLQFTDPELLAQQVLLTIFNGEAAVILFFVLSGCVLAMALERLPRITLRAVSGFYVKRVFRLYPAMWLSVLLAAATVPLIREGRVDALVSSWASLTYAEDLTWRQIVRGLMGIDNRLNQPLWSITIEIAYSAMLPVIYLMSRTRMMAAHMTALGVVLLLTPMSLLPPLHLYFLPFVLGAIIPFPQQGAKAPEFRPPWRLTTIGAVIALMLARRVWPQVEGEPPIHLIIESIAAVVIIHAVCHRRIGTAWLERPWLRWLGEASYGIYLLHFPVLFLIATAAMRFLPADMIEGAPLLANVALGVLTLAVTIPLARLCSYFVEQPATAIGKALAERATRLPAAIASAPSNR